MAMNTPISKQLTTTDATRLTTLKLVIGRCVTVWARAGNSGTIAVGDATAQVGALAAGDTIDMYPTTADEIYAKASSANDYVDIICYT